MKCMLRWDIKKQTSKGKGILGTVVAFSAADEEKGRKTLHWHWHRNKPNTKNLFVSRRHY
jgi:hypothetical protein